MLREDFGFDHLLWVFSGRRGVHCWVSDQTALELPNEGRAALAEYLSVYIGNEMSGSTANLSSPLHPSLAQAATVIREEFKDIMIEGQEIMRLEAHRKKILDCIPEFDLRKRIQEQWDEHSDKSGRQLWSIVEQVIGDYN